MDRIKITKKQQKILIISGIVAATFLVFLLVIYLPSSKSMDRLKKEYEGIDSEIKKIHASFGKGVSLERAIDILKEKLRDMEAAFPDREELVLREITALASKKGLEVVSIKPEKKRVIKDIEGVPVSIKGCVIQEMPITITLNASYKSFGDFLENSREKFPIFVRADNVKFQKAEGKKEGMLKIEIQLNSYMVVPSNG